MSVIMGDESGFVSVKGLKIYREIRGTGDPVILLHGGMGTVADFRFQIPELAKQFKVISFERPGHGRTRDPGGEFDFDTMKEYTVSFLEKLGIGPYGLVGYSDGGIVALLVAINRPDLVRKLVVVSSNYNTKIYDEKTKRSMLSLTPESFRKGAGPEFMKLYDTATPNAHERFPLQLEKTKKLWVSQPNIPETDLAKIKVPTLVMAADDDAAPIEHIIKMYQSIKGAQLCIIPGATHFLLSEKPALVNQVILSFLKR